jgi:hypothetical protein
MVSPHDGKAAAEAAKAVGVSRASIERAARAVVVVWALGGGDARILRPLQPTA